ncbi:hypothetical protein AB1282_20305 [Gottfriedia sp. S16(2024)]|uniref:hypothetical protein n=1 Tax=Gottfriedia sp. S16(2024) TaxID=3162883 RepID=UPI003D211069
MSSTYKVLVDIDLENGDVQITVSGDYQVFNFISGLSSIILPQLFSELSSLYSGKSSRARLSNYGNGDYYNFIKDSNIIRIENIMKNSGVRNTYHFNLNQFVTAIDKAFSKHLRQLRKEGVLPLKFEEKGHPLEQNVIDKYNDFSSTLKRLK